MKEEKMGTKWLKVFANISKYDMCSNNSYVWYNLWGSASLYLKKCLYEKSQGLGQIYAWIAYNIPPVNA